MKTYKEKKEFLKNLRDGDQNSLPVGYEIFKIGRQFVHLLSMHDSKITKFKISFDEFLANGVYGDRA